MMKYRQIFTALWVLSLVLISACDIDAANSYLAVDYNGPSVATLYVTVEFGGETYSFTMNQGDTETIDIPPNLAGDTTYTVTAVGDETAIEFFETSRDEIATQVLTAPEMVQVLLDYQGYLESFRDGVSCSGTVVNYGQTYRAVITAETVIEISC